jgi:hypothetical protein
MPERLPIAQTAARYPMDLADAINGVLERKLITRNQAKAVLAVLLPRLPIASLTLSQRTPKSVVTVSADGFTFAVNNRAKLQKNI